MKRILSILFWSIIILNLSIHSILNAKNDTLDKPVVAVMEFKAYNCPTTLSMVAEGAIGSHLFKSQIFNLIERGQINQVIKELELQQTGCTDSTCLVEMGKMLTANKIITGSIHHIDDYTVIAKVVDVETGKIEANYKKIVASETEVSDAINDIAYRIALAYRSDIYYSVSASALFLYPLGDFGNIAKGGWGTGVNFNVHNIFIKNLNLRASTGYFSFDGKDKSINSIMMVPLAGYAGYQFHLNRYLKIMPLLGGGYLLNMMKFDKDGSDAFGNYEYTSRAFHDSFFSARIEVSYRLYDMLHIVTAPSYTYIFEKNSNSQMFGCHLGVEFSF